MSKLETDKLEYEKMKRSRTEERKSRMETIGALRSPMPVRIVGGSQRLLDAYDRLAPFSESEEELIQQISQETKINLDLVKSFLKSYLELE